LDELIAEQKFQLSDLADETKQVEIGKLLSAQYIISGSIFIFAFVTGV
jgi:hypothetical protein